jgi:hypothetical protein
VAKVKGVVVLNVREFALARDGEKGWRRVLDRLSPEDQRAHAEVIPVGWYDVGLYDRANRALVDALGEGRVELMVAVGHSAAERDLTTIHRLFLRAANPAYVIERSAAYWGRFQDSGTWSVERLSVRRVRATLQGWGSTDPASCVRLAAYIERLFQLVGAKNGRLVRTACKAQGDAACVFEGEWD